ncbi:MAG: 50S ribosomal protein L24 [Acidobacteria bacterium]|nr:50S ribosomal protein L24 [Acidobacteriota bacterium]
MKIKKGDTVQIMVGKDRGQQGKVLDVILEKNRVLVEGLNLVKKHQRAGGGQEAGIIEKEAPLNLSNVMLVDPSDSKPTRVGFKVDNGKKHRFSKRTGQLLD